MGLKTALYQHLKGDQGVAFTVVAITDLFTAAHSRSAGDKVRLGTTGTLPDPLAVDTDYFVRDISGNDFKLAATVGGAAVDITDTGSGTHTLGTAVTDQVTTRIYAGRSPQGVTDPYIVYSRVSENRNHTITAPDGIVTSRIQFDCFSNNIVNCEDIVEALRTHLDGYNKAMGTEALDVRLVRMDDVDDQFLNPIHGDELGMIQVSTDFFFTYAETAPGH